MKSTKTLFHIASVVGALLLSGCSGEQQDSMPDDAPASVESTATPAATPAPTPDAAPTPAEERSRTDRVAEHQRRIQEIIKQKRLEQQAEQAPGTDTQYQ